MEQASKLLLVNEPAKSFPNSEAIMSEVRRPKYGVYLSPTGKLKVLEPHKSHKYIMVLDQGKTFRHPLLRVTIPLVETMSLSWPVFEEKRLLKDCEYLGDL